MSSRNPSDAEAARLSRPPPCDEGDAARAAGGLTSLVERVRHLFGHRLGVCLSDVLTVAPSSPSKSVMDV